MCGPNMVPVHDRNRISFRAGSVWHVLRPRSHGSTKFAWKIPSTLVRRIQIPLTKRVGIASQAFPLCDSREDGPQQSHLTSPYIRKDHRRFDSCRCHPVAHFFHHNYRYEVTEWTFLN